MKICCQNVDLPCPHRAKSTVCGLNLQFTVLAVTAESRDVAAGRRVCDCRAVGWCHTFASQPRVYNSVELRTGVVAYQQTVAVVTAGRGLIPRRYGMISRRRASAAWCCFCGKHLAAGSTCVLHLPILDEPETHLQNRPVARGVLKKVADHFFQFTPRPRGFLTGRLKMMRGKFVFCKYPRSLASKTRLLDRIESLRDNKSKKRGGIPKNTRNPDTLRKTHGFCVFFCAFRTKISKNTSGS